MEKVGHIIFGTICLDVYNSLDEPLFLGKDVADILDYSENNIWKLTNVCEQDEIQKLPVEVAGHTRTMIFVNERGLYNILSQSRKQVARGWRRIVHDELIAMRKHKELNIEQRFEEWDHLLDTLYFDETTGVIMQSVTVPGGDVEQVPFE